jgi:hypothetical protein
VSEEERAAIHAAAAARSVTASELMRRVALGAREPEPAEVVPAEVVPVVAPRAVVVAEPSRAPRVSPPEGLSGLERVEWLLRAGPGAPGR